MKVASRGVKFGRSVARGVVSRFSFRRRGRTHGFSNSGVARGIYNRPAAADDRTSGKQIRSEVEWRLNAPIWLADIETYFGFRLAYAMSFVAPTQWAFLAGMTGVRFCWPHRIPHFLDDRRCSGYFT